MVAGLRIRDDAGSVILDITDRFPRIIGWFHANAPGSMTVPAFAENGTPWAAIVNDLSQYTSMTQEWSGLTTYISGTTLSWGYQPNMNPAGAPTPNTLIMYGIY